MRMAVQEASWPVICVLDVRIDAISTPLDLFLNTITEERGTKGVASALLVLRKGLGVCSRHTVQLHSLRPSTKGAKIMSCLCPHIIWFLLP